MQSNKKGLVISMVVILIVVLGAAGYYFFVMKKSTPVVWDGFYNMVGSIACQGNIPNLTNIPMDSTFEVKNNEVIEPTIGKNFPIDKNGKAVEVIDLTQGDVKTVGTGNLWFVKEGDLYKFTGEMLMTVSITQANKTYSSDCKGTASGSKK